MLTCKFILQEQSHGHSKSKGLAYEKFGKMLTEQRLKFKPNITLEERLGHLRYREPWE